MFITELASLIAALSTERSLGRIEGKQDILNRLEESNQQELKRLLETNSRAMESIEALLHEDRLGVRN